MSCAQETVPPGWKVWRGTAVPDPLTQFAIDVRDHVRSYPYGSIAKTIQYNGMTVGAFVSHHSWTYRNGVLVTGLCIPGVSLITKQAGVGAGANSTTDTLDTPDPTAAVYGADDLPSKTDWPIVGACAALIGGAVFLFLQAIKTTAKAAR